MKTQVIREVPGFADLFLSEEDELVMVQVGGYVNTMSKKFVESMIGDVAEPLESRVYIITP